jgi:hypothetical protein
MVEEDLEETQMPAYTFSTWKKQVAVGAEGFEDLVESVLGLESKYSTHEKNTQIHTSQAEKDAWNGKAKIKGLESGRTKLLGRNEINFDLNTLASGYSTENSVYCIYRIADKAVSNAPETGYLHKIETVHLADHILQTFQTGDGLRVYSRYYANIAKSWSSWKLIAQDQEGVAKIKGLESGLRETLPENFNVLNLEFKEARYVVNSTNIALSNLPENGYFFIDVKVRKEANTYAVLYAYRDSVHHKMYVRRIGSGLESSWKLIAQDQEGVAKIKGLESGSTELKYNFNFDNAPNNSTYIAQNSINLPNNSEFALVITNTNFNYATGVRDTGVQTANYLVSGKIYQRFLGASVWQPWRLIAQPQTVLTNRIEELEEKIEQLETILRKTHI